MRVLNVLLAATAATFVFCCADGAVTSKRSLRSYDMNDLNSETENDEERMIKFSSMEKIDEFFGSLEKFEKLFDPKKVREAFADGKKLDDWLDQAILDKLLVTGPTGLRPTFTEWKAKGITADGLLATLKVNEAVQYKYSRVQQLYTVFLKPKAPQAAH